MAVNVYNIEVGHSFVSLHFARLVLKVVQGDTLGEGVDAKDLGGLVAVPFPADTASQSCLFLQLLHLLQH